MWSILYYTMLYDVLLLDTIYQPQLNFYFQYTSSCGLVCQDVIREVTFVLPGLWGIKCSDCQRLKVKLVLRGFRGLKLMDHKQWKGHWFSLLREKGKYYVFRSSWYDKKRITALPRLGSLEIRSDMEKWVDSTGLYL